MFRGLNQLKMINVEVLFLRSTPRHNPLLYYIHSHYLLAEFLATADEKQLSVITTQKQTKKKKRTERLCTMIPLIKCKICAISVVFQGR